MSCQHPKTEVFLNRIKLSLCTNRRPW